MHRFLLLLAFAVGIGGSARAERLLPADAPMATVAPLEFPFVKIDGKAAKLAPGAVIFDLSNRTVLPVSLPAQALALYERDNGGEVSRIWLLTADEAAELKARRK
jgi:hypothetical protein